MTLEKRVKTGVVSGLTLAALASGTTYAETFENDVIGRHSTPLSYYKEIEVNTFTFDQTFGSNVNMFTKIDTLISQNINTHESIIEDALTQINNYNFIEVDDEIDKKIDAYFAKRKSEKTKVMLYKRA